MKKHFIKFISILFLTTSCGFKIANLNNNLKFVEINTAGDNKISYLLKNRLSANSSNQSSYPIIINANTVLKKNIKEKNIKNQITKYQIKIETNIDYKNLDKNLSNKFKIVKSGHYNVASKFSKTKDNENKLLDGLIDEIVEEISSKISFDLNDF